MHVFEYLVGLVSILIGLALADLSLSLHRLLRSSHPVRWHWHSLASAVVVVLLVLDFWWGLRQLERIDVTVTIGSFLPLLASLVVFFLLAASALPDEVPQDGLDLRDYYDRTAKYFWSLLSLYILLTTAHVMLTLTMVLGAREAFAQRTPIHLAPNLLIVILALTLTRVRNRWWNSAVIIFLLLALLNSHVTRPLT